MSEAWKNRLWQLVLVCTFAVVLSVCQKAVDSSSDGSSSSGTAFADGSTVTISSMSNLTVASTATVSSMPELKVSSMPSVTVASQALHTVSAVLYCTVSSFSGGVQTFKYCDSSDSTSIDSSNNYSITLGEIVSAGFRTCSSPGSGVTGYNAHFFFCK